MVNEFKDIPKRIDLYITEEINDNLYSTLKKEVNTKLREIEEIHVNNEKWYRNNDLDPASFKKPITEFVIHLSTYGGSVYDGLGVYDLLTSLETIPWVRVIVLCEGKVMSCGVIIMLAVKNRKATRNTNFMIHELSSGTFWKLSQMKEDIEECKRLQSVLDDIILSNTKITRVELDDWYSHKKDFFFDSTEALERGLINEIV